MKLFQNVTEILKYKTAADFAMDAEITAEDFILASRHVYETYFVPLNLSAHVEFKDKYGNSEPTDRMADMVIRDFTESGCKNVIAIGGGAVMDLAKLLILKDVSTAAEAYSKPPEKVRSLTCIPTTCGSGSEVSCVSILEFTGMGTKLGLSAPALFPDRAVLIPELIHDLPYRSFAASSIDALIHASESFLSPKASEYTRIWSLEAIKKIISGFKIIADEGAEARLRCLDDFMTASNMAGIAFAVAGTGAVHAMSYPLSGKYHVTHGVANYCFFTEILKEYKKLSPDAVLIGRFEKLLSAALGCEEAECYDCLQELLGAVLPYKTPGEYGMQSGECTVFAADVTANQQRLLNQSPVKLTTEQIEAIYRRLL